MDICRKGVPYVPYAHYPKCLEVGTGANGHFGQMDVWRRSTPSVLCPSSPNFFKLAFGVPSAHLLQCPFRPSAHLEKMGTRAKCGIV